MSAAVSRTEDVITSSDMISHLPDDLLLQIISLVPISEAMNTSLLSKRWISLWKMMPVLEYVETSCPKNMTPRGFVEFCRRSLQLHEAPVLKTLTIKPKDRSDPLILPSCFPERVFEKLVVLKLDTMFCHVFDDSPPVCFRSLKSLHLARVWFRDGQSFCRLISACPVLEDLLFDSVRTFACSPIILPPSQQRLEIANAPSLKYLKMINGFYGGRLIFTKDMPNLVEATLAVHDPCQTKDFLRFLNPVEFLSIYLFANEVMLLADAISARLLRLELYFYGKVPRNLLLHLLKHSPRLQVLKLGETHQYYLTIEPTSDPLPSVCNPSSVPECLSFHLQTFQWISYRRTVEENLEAVRYILQNARCLKTAAISVYSEDRRPRKKERLIIKELKSMPKASTSCQLVITRVYR